MIHKDPALSDFLLEGAHEKDEPLSRQMMTMWTNFAKSG